MYNRKVVDSVDQLLLFVPQDVHIDVTLEKVVGVIVGILVFILKKVNLLFKI